MITTITAQKITGMVIPRGACRNPRIAHCPFENQMLVHTLSISPYHEVHENGAAEIVPAFENQYIVKKIIIISVT